MELTLVRRYTISKAETKEIKKGIRILYYGNGAKWINTPSHGEIGEDENGFFIVWEDFDTNTPLDGSQYSNDILKMCGFY